MSVDMVYLLLSPQCCLCPWVSIYFIISCSLHLVSWLYYLFYLCFIIGPKFEMDD